MKQLDNDTKSTVFRPILSLMVTMFVVAMIQAVHNIVTARLFGPTGKGLYTLCITLVSFAFLVLTLNTQSSMTYLAGRNRDNIAPLLSYQFILVGAISCLSFVLYLVCPSAVLNSALPNFPRGLWLFAGILFPLIMLNNFLSGILLGLQQIRIMNVAKIVQASSALFLMLIFFALFEKTIAAALYALILSLIIGNLVSLRPLYVQLNFTQRIKIRSQLVKDSISYGVKGYVGNLFQFFNYRLDIFFVSYFLSPAQVGIYSVATLLAELLWYLPNSVASILFSNTAQNKAKPSVQTISQIFRFTWVFVGLGSIILIFSGRYIIALLFGTSFATAYLALVCLLPGIFFLGMSKVLTGYFSGIGKPQYGSIASTIGFMITIVGDIVMIPRFGIAGAALASSLSYVVATLIVIRLFLKDTAGSSYALFKIHREDVDLLITKLKNLKQITWRSA